jgi:hypothetical protein
MDNIYRVNENAVINKKAVDKFDWYLRVNLLQREMSLDAYLCIFAMTQKVKDKLKEEFTNRKDLYQIIEYLLRNNFINENFYYYYLIFPLRKEIEMKRYGMKRGKSRSTSPK